MPINIDIDTSLDDPLHSWAATVGFTVFGDQGIPIAGDHENALRALVWLGFHNDVRLDRWSGRTEIQVKDGWEQFDGTNHITTIKIAMEQAYKTPPYVPTRAAVEAAVGFAAEINGLNTRVDAIRGAEWDRRDRYPAFAKALRQSYEDELSLEVSKLMVRGIVARALRPGTDFPYCPIMYSPDQGVGKGQVLKILSGDYHAELHEGVFSAPNALQMLVERFRGKSVVEIGEFNGLRPKAQDVLKSVITDGMFGGVRLAYGREARDWPMTAIMVGTTNSSNVLSDYDNRRHPVITIQKGEHIDLAWLYNNVQQLWAQAASEYDGVMAAFTESVMDASNWGVQPKNSFMDADAGIIVNSNGQVQVRIPERLWLPMAQRSNQFRQINPLEEWLEIELAKYEGMRLKGLPLFEIARAKFGRVDSRAFSDAMNACGWQKKRVTANGGKVNVWEQLGATGEIIDLGDLPVSLLPM